VPAGIDATEMSAVRPRQRRAQAPTAEVGDQRSR